MGAAQSEATQGRARSGALAATWPSLGVLEQELEMETRLVSLSLSSSLTGYSTKLLNKLLSKASLGRQIPHKPASH